MMSRWKGVSSSSPAKCKRCSSNSPMWGRSLATMSSQWFSSSSLERRCLLSTARMGQNTANCSLESRTTWLRTKEWSIKIGKSCKTWLVKWKTSRLSTRCLPSCQRSETLTGRNSFITRTNWPCCAKRKQRIKTSTWRVVEWSSAKAAKIMNDWSETSESLNRLSTSITQRQRRWMRRSLAWWRSLTSFQSSWTSSSARISLWASIASRTKCTKRCPTWKTRSPTSSTG